MAEQEPSDEGVENAPSPAPPKGRRALSRMRREMTEEELSNSGVAKMLADDADMLRDEVARLQGYEAKYHEADKKAAMLEQKLKQNKALEIMYTGLITVGSLSVGYGTTTSNAHSTFAIIAGAILILAALLAKVVSR